jgi:predicted aspartyl protease
MYISLDRANRRTPQISKIISDYNSKGNCDLRYATGTARIQFAKQSDVRIVPVAINGIVGQFVVDTGASFVSTTSHFATKSKMTTEPDKQILLKQWAEKSLLKLDMQTLSR